MFMPGRNVQQEVQEKQRIFKRVEEWSMNLIPENIRGDATVSVQEVQCGDPQCAPIDTIIQIFFESGGQGMFGLPMDSKSVTQNELENFFPTPDILEAWHRGDDAEWPPQDDDVGAGGAATPGGSVPLRFAIGTNVLCRVGPTEWAPGEVIQLWYREAGWPEGAFAPYKIKLQDGRDIFAPADMDQIIKAAPVSGADTGKDNTVA